MKLTATIVLSFFLYLIPARGATVTIEVEDYEFNPTIFSVNIGDTLIWFWDEGVHTTTSTNIPSGAVPWNHDITETSPVFIYIPTVAGSYDYQCTFHASMNMLGHFTVVNNTGITTVGTASLRLRSNYVSDFLDFEQEGNIVNILPVVRDLTGRIVKRFEGSTLQSTNQFFVGDLKNGIYIFQLVESDRRNNYRFIKY